MKTFIYLLICISIFFFPKTVFSQNNDLECQQGIDSAKVKIEKGEYEYKIYGTSINNYHTFSRLLQNGHSIKVSYDIGCVVFEKEECYSNYMNTKTREKYGKAEIEKVWQKAKYMDSVGLGDRNAVFEEGNEKMYQLIYSNLDWKKTDFYKNPEKYEEEKKHKVFVQIHIDYTVSKVFQCFLIVLRVFVFSKTNKTLPQKRDLFA